MIEDNVEPMPCTPEDRTMLAVNRCPSCLNYGFIEGPRGGASRNIYCFDPECRAAFNVGPVLMIAQRIGRARLCHYPPLVHIIEGMYAMCRFTMIADTVHWPYGHRAVDMAHARNADCPDCLTTLRSRGKRR